MPIIPRESILFLDIETVPQYPDFEKVPANFQQLWEEKLVRQRLLKENESIPESYGRAGLYAEFGKIICIVVGFFDKGAFQLRSFSGDEEQKILIDFALFIEKLVDYRKPGELILCAHNGKEFDFPYIARRMLINRVVLPPILDNAGKKPWEVQHIDTLDLWKFGDYKAYSSLNLLANIFGLPSPKQDLDGSKVASTYWEKHDLPLIVKYCCADVTTLANVYLCLKGQDPFDESIVIYKA